MCTSTYFSIRLLAIYWHLCGKGDIYLSHQRAGVRKQCDVCQSNKRNCASWSRKRDGHPLVAQSKDLRCKNVMSSSEFLHVIIFTFIIFYAILIYWPLFFLVGPNLLFLLWELCTRYDWKLFCIWCTKKFFSWWSFLFFKFRPEILEKVDWRDI